MPRFRQRVEAIVEAFSTMQEDLDKERKAKQWAKREEQIEREMMATVGVCGDLQGITGKSLQEIKGLKFSALEDMGREKMDD